MKLLYTILLLAGLALTSETALAQHGGHHGYSGGHRPIYHGVYYGHSGWNFVVPFYAGYAGGYYTEGSSYYYTPQQISPLQTEPTDTTTPTAPAPMTEASKPIQLKFGAFAHYQDLAGRLAAEVNAMCLDMHNNYSENKNFAEVYAEAYSVLELAKAIQADKGDHDAIAKRATDAHKKLHQFMDQAGGWTRSAKKQVGTDGLDEKMARGEAITHHLLYDVGVKLEEPPAGAPLGVVDPKEEAPRPAKR